MEVGSERDRLWSLRPLFVSKRVFNSERFAGLGEMEETKGSDSVAKGVRGAEGDENDEMTYHQDESKTYPSRA